MAYFKLICSTTLPMSFQIKYGFNQNVGGVDCFSDHIVKVLLGQDTTNKFHMNRKSDIHRALPAIGALCFCGCF